VSFNGGASQADINGALSAAGASADFQEQANFMGVLNADRNALTTSITDTCAKALGAKNAQQVENVLAGLTFSITEPGPLNVTTNSAGIVTATDPNQYLAQYSSGGFFGGKQVQFNGSVNWSDPSKTIGVDQNGVQVIDNVVAGMAFLVGANSMTNTQFTELIILHELSHRFGRNHGADSSGFTKNIWTNCLQ
jgi:hypothetical protein